jgi:hypothetical protein
MIKSDQALRTGYTSGAIPAPIAEPAARGAKIRPDRRVMRRSAPPLDCRNS